MASVLLRTAPNVFLCIARVADDDGIIVQDNDFDNVAKVRSCIIKIG